MLGLSLVAASGGHSSSRCAGLPPPRPPTRCGAQAPDTQAQQLRLTGPAAPRHAGSSQTRARTRVPRIGRQTLNHCATREAPGRWILNHWTTREVPASPFLSLMTRLKCHMPRVIFSGPSAPHYSVFCVRNEVSHVSVL